MGAILSFLTERYSTEWFPARWYCGQWSESLGWQDVSNNISTCVGYLLVAAVLIYYRDKSQFRRSTLWTAVAFLVFCGGSHGLYALEFWWPVYPFAADWGTIQVITIIAFLGSAWTERGRWHSSHEWMLREREHSMRRELELQIVANSCSTPFYFTDSHGICTFISRSMADMVGYRVSDCLGKNIHDLIHHTNEKGEKVPIEDCPMFQGDAHTKCDRDVFWTSEGRSIAVAWEATTVMSDGHEIGKRVEVRQLSSTDLINQFSKDFGPSVMLALHQSVLREMECPVVVADEKGNIVLASNAYCEQVDRLPHFVIGKRLADIENLENLELREFASAGSVYRISKGGRNGP